MMKRRKNKEENRDHQPYTKTTAIIQVIMTIALVVFLAPILIIINYSFKTKKELYYISTLIYFKFYPSPPFLFTVTIIFSPNLSTDSFFFLLLLQEPRVPHPDLPCPSVPSSSYRQRIRKLFLCRREALPTVPGSHP